MEHSGWGEGKENDRESTISKYFTSAQVDDITICTESCRIMGGGTVKKSNKGGWTDQSKAYFQLGYIEKSLWMLTLELIMKDKTIKQVQWGGGNLWEVGWGEWRRWNEAIGLMGFLYIKEIEQWNLLQLF
jgi:hypothetical protein